MVGRQGTGTAIGIGYTYQVIDKLAEYRVRLRNGYDIVQTSSSNCLYASAINGILEGIRCFTAGCSKGNGRSCIGILRYGAGTSDMALQVVSHDYIVRTYHGITERINRIIGNSSRTYFEHMCADVVHTGNRRSCSGSATQGPGQIFHRTIVAHNRIRNHHAGFTACSIGVAVHVCRAGSEYRCSVVCNYNIESASHTYVSGRVSNGIGNLCGTYREHRSWCMALRPDQVCSTNTVVGSSWFCPGCSSAAGSSTYTGIYSNIRWAVAQYRCFGIINRYGERACAYVVGGICCRISNSCRSFRECVAGVVVRSQYNRTEISTVVGSNRRFPAYGITALADSITYYDIRRTANDYRGSSINISDREHARRCITALILNCKGYRNRRHKCRYDCTRSRILGYGIDTASISSSNQ